MTHPQPAPDLSAWLTKNEASEAIQVSFKTLEKFVTDGKLQSAKRRQPGKPDATVYHPEDVERLRRERHPAASAFVVPKEDFANPSRTSQMLVPTGIAAGLEQVITEGLRVQFANASQVRLTERLFLSIAEASELSGLPKTLLKFWIQEGKLEALKTGRGWRIRRKDLEAL